MKLVKSEIASQLLLTAVIKHCLRSGQHGSMVVNLKLSAGFVQSKFFLPGLKSFVVHRCAALLYSYSNGELFFKRGQYRLPWFLF
jgi:hypothetical protein